MCLIICQYMSLLSLCTILYLTCDKHRPLPTPGGYLSPENDEKKGSPVFSKVQGNIFWVQLVTGRRGLPGEKNMTDFDQTLHGPGMRVRYRQHLHCLETDLVN